MASAGSSTVPSTLTAVAPPTATTFSWSPGALTLVFGIGEHPVRLCGMSASGEAVATATTQPLVELMVTGDGRARTTTRFTNTGVGSRLRHVEHRESAAEGERRLDILQRDDLTGLEVTSTFLASPEVAGVRTFTTVINGGTVPHVLEAVTSLAFGAAVRPGEDPREIMLHSGTGEQLAENRWTIRPLWSQQGVADFNSALHGQPGRGAVEAVSTSTWSTARDLPTGVLENAASGHAIAWQIEHNGPWRWEIDNVRLGEDSVAVLLMGPEDLDHQWSQVLSPGDQFRTVPASLVTAENGATGAVAALTAQRRWLRRYRTADTGRMLVFNDYMNTLNGDPTTERLLPLIDAAAAVGAECFCIDAGWYDDSALGDWWPSVGVWEPSKRRFSDGGLARVVNAIRARGMKVGLWVEPEVVGVLSPVADALPDAAFLMRHGLRVREHDRYFLDLRHPAAQAHLDTTVDRLVTEFGVDFFKFDYNVTPGPGTDHNAFSVGAGLLGHCRAHLDWVERLQRRHRNLVIENCSSGAMRADFAMLERFDFQSTSDQQDFSLYPSIAAGAPLQILPEQAGNWAYPQPEMALEEIAFTMVTGLAGRLYMSGFLDRMDPEQLDLVRDAATIFRGIRDEIAASTPAWPTGYPEWDDEVITLRLDTPRRQLLYVWHRTEANRPVTVPVRSGNVVATEIFPRSLPAWDVTSTDGSLTFTPASDGLAARLYEITVD